MFNVMKAQKFQLLRSNGTYYAFLSGLLLYAFACVIMMADGSMTDRFNGSSWLLYVGGSAAMIQPIITLVFAALVCSGDMDDKTINYEVLNGRKRIEVYLGRAFMTMIMNVLCCVVTMVLPLLAVTALCGWGHMMTVSDVALRIAAMILPVIRLSAFFTFVAFLFRSKVALYVTGYVITMIESLVIAFDTGILKPELLIHLFSSYTLQKIFVIENIGFDYIDGKDVQVVKDVLEMSTVRTAGVSCIVGTVIFLVLGYFVFRKKDMN